MNWLCTDLIPKAARNSPLNGDVAYLLVLTLLRLQQVGHSPGVVRNLLLPVVELFKETVLSIDPSAVARRNIHSEYVFIIASLFNSLSQGLSSKLNALRKLQQKQLLRAETRDKDSAISPGAEADRLASRLSKIEV